ncbi:pLS20_p028 family conjugation system transmembrane protein [Listeria booriae]|uniref:pLS20_p028 family conjugation system transmembrane protein n=1 Tax=Listeria booriae TaxID=1552123 RepID=UPI00162ACB61|nr:hypothetical protein [Listeria booriae]MBC2174814.1 hypothetical protein [Listeria booriae]
MKEEELLKLLIKFSDFFSINSFAKDVFRDMFMWLIKGLVTVNSVMENVFFYAIKLISWPTTKTMEVLINDPAKGLVIIALALMVLTLMFIGGKMIMGDRVSAQEFTRNFLMAVLVLIGLSGFMGSLEKLTFAGVEVGKNAFSSEENSMISYQIVKDNITDLKALDADKWQTTTPKKANYLKEANWKSVNFNEVIQDDFKNAKDLSKKRIDQNESGEDIVADLDSSFWLPATNDYYYRYHVSFTAIIIQEIFILLVFAFSTLIIVQTAFELGIKGTIGPFIAATDLATGQRIKNLITDIIGAYVKIIVLVFVIQLYRVFMNWTQTLSFSDSLTETLVLKCLIVVGAFFAVLRGSGSVQRLLGIDVSQGFGQQALMGTLAGAQIMKGAGSLASGATKGAARQFGKNGFVGKRAQNLANKRSENAKRQALTEGLGGKESYKEKMNPKRQAQREGYNESQQILATEQAMNQQKNTISNPDHTPSDKGSTNSGSGSGSELSGGKQSNQSPGQSNQGEQSSDNRNTSNTSASPPHANSTSANGGSQELSQTTQQESTPGGETKQGSRAVDRLNQQRKTNPGTNKTAPANRMASPSASYSNSMATSSGNDLEGQEEKEEMQYSTRPQRKTPQKVNRQVPKPISRQVPKKPEKTHGKATFKSNKPQTE